MPYGKNSELPDPVKKALPTAAQNVFRAAFNSFMERNEGASEEQAFQVAWAAVKRGWHKVEGKWVKKEGDAAPATRTIDMDALEEEVVDAYEAARVIHLDGLTETVELSDADIRETADGFLTAFVKSGRSGIQLYRGSELGLKGEDAGRAIRVYRPPEEVFHKDAMHSYAHRPVTLNHPKEFVDAKNWREYARGSTGGDVVRDGEFVRVPLVLMDGDAIKQVKDGTKKELSWGYSTDLRWAPGLTLDGEEYDAVQTSIRANHLAVVSVARGGDELRIGDDNQRGDDSMTAVMKTILVDGVNLEMSDVSAAVVQRAVSRLQAELDKEKDEKGKSDKKAKDDAEAFGKQIADLTTSVSTKDGEIAALKQKLADAEVTPAKLDAMVKDRSAVVDKAKALCGAAFVADGKTVQDMRREAVTAKLGEAVAKTMNDDAVTGAFNALTATVDNTANLAASFAANGHRPGFAQAATDEREKAWNDQGSYLKDAWKNPQGRATQ